MWTIHFAYTKEEKTILDLLWITTTRNLLSVPLLPNNTKDFNKLGITDLIFPWFYGGRNFRRHFHPPKERPICKENCKFCALNGKTNMCYQKNVIYEIRCTICQMKYIGETQRMVRSRLNEHIFLNSESAVKDHFKDDHPNASITSSISWRILHSGIKHYKQRQTLEAMYIKQANSALMNCVGQILHSL